MSRLNMIHYSKLRTRNPYKSFSLQLQLHMENYSTFLQFFSIFYKEFVMAH